MIIIDNVIIDKKIFTTYFACNLQSCKGTCCIEGVSGAPLLKNELRKIEKILPKIRKYILEDANKVIDEKGCAEIDIDNELVTNTVKNRDCVFVTKENDIYLCAIEKLFIEKQIDFRKPISCHLYPIRLEEKDGLFNLKYDSWYICESALSRNRELSKPTIIFLKDALIRQFGEEWYEKAINYYQKFFGSL